MMTIKLLWDHLAQNPVLWLCLTLLAYQAGIWVYKKSGYLTILSPFVIAVTVLLLILFATGTTYETFFAGAQFVHFLLGPATVALAVPLFDQRRRLAKLWAPLLIGVTVGCIVGVSSTVLLGIVFDASVESIVSMAPKSVTTPIAMAYQKKWAASRLLPPASWF
jgi:putative effector of murein hydrolase